MSSILWTMADLHVLPSGMIDLAKVHLRIDGMYEDALIRTKIASAIAWFQNVTNVSVNPVTWKWQPDSGNFRDGAAKVPVSPVGGYTVSDSNGGDISSGYSVTTISTHGVGLYALNGSFVSGMSVTIQSGYANATLVDPGITDILLRYTAHLYENREILVPNAEVQTPGWMTDVVSTYWMPRV